MILMLNVLENVRSFGYACFFGARSVRAGAAAGIQGFASQNVVELHKIGD
jgi:hypothetical protein